MAGRSRCLVRVTVLGLGLPASRVTVLGLGLGFGFGFGLPMPIWDAMPPRTTTRSSVRRHVSRRGLTQ